jgi:hypothetical protein
MAKKAKPASTRQPAADDLLTFDTDELLSAVTERIAATGCPDPSFMVEDLDPLGALWLGHELVQEVLRIWTDALVSKPPEDEGDLAELTRPLAGITMAFSALTRACVWAGLLPEKVMEGMDEI